MPSASGRRIERAKPRVNFVFCSPVCLLLDEGCLVYRRRVFQICQEEEIDRK
jgi:hypothetical protein